MFFKIIIITGLLELICLFFLIYEFAIIYINISKIRKMFKINKEKGD